MGASSAFSLLARGLPLQGLSPLVRVCEMNAKEPGDLIRISISGTHSTGKTTLAGNLAEALNERGVKTLVAPEPIRLLDELPGQQSVNDRYLNLLRIHLQRLSQPEYQCCIYDRSLLDFCVYLHVEKIPVEGIYLLAREMLAWYLPYFAAHIYLPVELNMTADNRRPKNEAYRQEIDREFIDLTDGLGVQLHSITGSVEARTQQAVQLVEDAIRRGQPEGANPQGVKY